MLRDNAMQTGKRPSFSPSHPPLHFGRYHNGHTLFCRGGFGFLPRVSVARRSSSIRGPTRSSRGAPSLSEAHSFTSRTTRDRETASHANRGASPFRAPACCLHHPRVVWAPGGKHTHHARRRRRRGAIHLRRDRIDSSSASPTARWSRPASAARERASARPAVIAA